ncbi:GTP-binding protein RAD isoform X2 [Sceloporus undulatus]|uniref:GTP-binding protein RAD isoform X2 n=1 Tax=Sceloporus undulatus TaxID=8520 RepID=UPI001C4B1A5E|nr:GTP-binding protein RAD isoform X2 [Sceloporus undulatus]
MTLNRGVRARGLDRRRGSMPFAAHPPPQPLHRRSMPVDERELRASLPPSPRAAHLLRCTSYNPVGEDGEEEATRPGWTSDSSDSVISSGSDSESRLLYKVILLGNTYDRSIIVDGEEASLVVYDIWEQDDSQWLQNHCMKMGDAYIIVYSVTDKVSFEKASELRIQLRRARQAEDIPIILVGNKSDLVRSREVSVDEGRACAVVFDCKFIETSAALHHNVKDLFEGIIRQIRLRKDSKEDNARRMANTKRRESISKKAKRFLGRIVAKNNKKMAFKAKSKSCHDLSVL